MTALRPGTAHKDTANLSLMPEIPFQISNSLLMRSIWPLCYGNNPHIHAGGGSVVPAAAS